MNMVSARLKNNTYDYRETDLPIQKWFSIVEGFSSNFVAERIERYSMTPGKLILDPFCGSGTTAVTCKYKGIDCISIDSNPWMYLATKAKTEWNVDLTELNLVKKSILDKIPKEYFEQEKIIGFYSEKDLPQGRFFTFPKQLTPLSISIHPPLLPRLEKKMAKTILMKTLFLKQIIKQQLEGSAHFVSENVKNLVWFAFGVHLMDVSNMTWYGPKVSWRKKFYLDAPVFTLFRDKLDTIERDILEVKTKHPHSRSEVILGDSRHVDCYVKDTIDCVLTSPPYMNEACYTDQSQFQLYFLDFVSNFNNLKIVKKRMLTCNTKYIFNDSDDSKTIENFKPVMEIYKQLVEQEEREKKKWGWNRPKMMLEYFGGMKMNLGSVYKILRNGGHYDLVLGDSAIAGVHIPTDILIAKLGEEVGYSQSQVDIFRKRQCSRHGVQLRESVVSLLK